MFAPEKGWQFEIGLKYDWNGLSLNGSYFYIHKDNVVTSLGTVEENGVSKQVRGQVGRMHSQGFDIDLNYTVGDFVFGGGYAYTDPRVGKIAANDYVTVNADRGNRYTYIPKNQFFITSDYEASAGKLKGFGGGAVAHLSGQSIHKPHERNHTRLLSALRSLSALPRRATVSGSWPQSTIFSTDITMCRISETR